MRIRLEKLEELPDAKHPNNIAVGVISEGEMLAEPKVGEYFWVGYNYRTSIVKEIINANTFKTCNSIYRWSLL
jgi:hypothetical protein